MLKMPMVMLFLTDSKPHTALLCIVYGFDNARNLIHKGNSINDVIEHQNLANSSFLKALPD